MAIVVDGKEIEVTQTGYLVNTEDWNEKVAEAIAADEGVELTQRHWDVIKYLREQYFDNSGSQPNNRTMVKEMGA
ncbi:MAG: TusE/DsrC/DsvC family sulfur relay protein, partial [Gammaproteobacteria bacterium]